MGKLKNTKHMEERMAQRHFTSHMVNIIMEYGKWTTDSRVILEKGLLDKAIELTRYSLSRLIEKLKVAKRYDETSACELVDLRRLVKKVKHKLKTMLQLLKKLPAILIAKKDVLVTVYQVW